MRAQRETLAPHPWDEVARRIHPDAHTAEEAARLLEKAATARLDDEITDLEFRVQSLQDDLYEAEEELEKLIQKRDAAGGTPE